MVSRSHLRAKKVWNADLDDHWITKLPPPPADDPLAGLCTEKSCEGWTPSIITNCVYGMCQMTWCAVCGRAGASWGPMGCPCDGNTFGHNTRGEQPPARGRVVVSQRNGYPDFSVIPFRKHKVKKRPRRRR